MLLPSTGPHLVQVNRWDQEALASWSSMTTIPGEIATDSPTQGWRPPSLNRAESGSKYIQRSTSSCWITAKVLQWQAWTIKMSSQPELLQMARSTTKEELLCECIAKRRARVIWMQKYLWNGYYTLILPARAKRTKSICFCFQPHRSWHKVNDPKVRLKWRLEEGKVRH